MKTAIVYASVHHGNTKKVLDAIKKVYDVELIDATQVKEAELSEYDMIGFASGIYYGKLHQAVLSFAEKNLPQDKKVFLMSTYGGNTVWTSIEAILQGKNAEIVGRFGCKGYDTFGPFKLVGGVAKGHPNEKDLGKAVEFYSSLTK